MQLVRYYPHGTCRTAGRNYNKPAIRRKHFTGHTKKGFLPSTDIIEDNNNYYLKAEFPGMSKEDISISVVEDNILKITGEKKSDESQEEIINLRKERSFGTFKRTFQLPEDADAEKIEAKTKNGVLTLTIPRLQPAEPKETNIEIS